MVTLPRLVVAAAASSAGKTTIATGLMAALTGQGRSVAGFKVGPDFIDPGYHALATGRPGRNLDPFLTSEELIPGLFLHGATQPATAGHHHDPADPTSHSSTTSPDSAAPATSGHPHCDPAAAGRPHRDPAAAVTATPNPASGPADRARRDPVNHPGDSVSPARSNLPSQRSGFGPPGLPQGGPLPHRPGQPELADLAIVEGVMGLFDGRLASDGFGSTAHVATLLETPVLLVVDAAGSSRTAAAAALGLRDFDPRLRVAGVIVNRVASPRHGAEIARVFESAGMPVLGLVPRNAGIAAPSRHLGLVPAAERGESAATIDALAEHLAAHVDLAAVADLAGTAADLAATAWRPQDVVTPVTGSPLVGVLAGRAFTFRYAETTELLEAAGCRVVEIDPLRDTALPAGLAALYAGGGFPEVHAAELGGNAALRADLAAAIADGLPTVAECAGQLYLGKHLDGHPMVAALPSTARMTPRLSLGYRVATAPSDTLLAPAGTPVNGHEFHRTQTLPPSGDTPAWQWDGRSEGFSADPAGTGNPTLHASYLHLHWAGHPDVAQRFAAAASSFAARGGHHHRPVSTAADGIDLRHHGDRDLAPGLVDLAVNVMVPEPPPWLADEIARLTPPLGVYPDARTARQALADRHGVDPAMVLPTAGGAEAFGLIARGLAPSHPMVVHPQFTEPEAALRAAGLAVQRWLLPVDAATVPALGGWPTWADAVFVGNPTNPTGWLHSRAGLLASAGDRLLVVDEAFMDATDEAESLIGPEMAGRLVLRSLSKTWGLAGLRVGYVVGDPDLVAHLEAAQPPWSVSSPALAAMIATSTPTALAEGRRRHAVLAAGRARFAAALAAAGFPSLPSVAPFLLIDTSACGPASVRPALAAAGFAVRRGESFPGLAPHWIRVRVPEPATATRFVAALTALRSR
ncbi:MAG: cobyrinate a,c-diamide synthase [Propionicimonas sp.]|nr:cobyrinate a,c-diamide synthase [Propionicimonas sp.]MEA4943850.1 cobyrinate a,c-diamide synthase [Propionicimonas sp.]